VLITENVKLSKRGEYALRALIDLGIAHELGFPILQASELAKKEKLPIKFLEQILAQLKLGGYVKSTRGKLGGYSLAKPMRRIKFGAVIRFIEGPLAPIRCVSQTAYARCTCPDEAHCGLRMLMLDLRNAIARLLDRYTLADIVQITLRKLRRDKITPAFLPSSIGLQSLLSGKVSPLLLQGRRKLQAPRQGPGRRLANKTNVHGLIQT
jgi:Rrf2 family protein